MLCLVLLRSRGESVARGVAHEASSDGLDVEEDREISLAVDCPAIAPVICPGSVVMKPEGGRGSGKG